MFFFFGLSASLPKYIHLDVAFSSFFWSGLEKPQTLRTRSFFWIYLFRGSQRKSIFFNCGGGGTFYSPTKIFFPAFGNQKGACFLEGFFLIKSGNCFKEENFGFFRPSGPPFKNKKKETITQPPLLTV